MTDAVDDRRRQRAADTERDTRARATQQAANALAARTIAEIEGRGVRADHAIGGRGQQGMEQLMRILGVRTRRVVEAVDGALEDPAPVGPDELADRVGGALAYVDALDEELSLVEAWLNRVGAVVPGDRVAAARKHHREALGLPGETEPVDLRDGRVAHVGSVVGSGFEAVFRKVMADVAATAGFTYEHLSLDWAATTSRPVLVSEDVAAEAGTDPDPYAFARERYGLKLDVGTRVRVRWPLYAETLSGVVVPPEPGSVAVRVELTFEDGISTVNVDARCVEVVHD